MNRIPAAKDWQSHGKGRLMDEWHTLSYDGNPGRPVKYVPIKLYKQMIRGTELWKMDIIKRKKISISKEYSRQGIAWVRTGNLKVLWPVCELYVSQCDWVRRVKRSDKKWCCKKMRESSQGYMGDHGRGCLGWFWCQVFEYGKWYSLFLNERACFLSLSSMWGHKKTAVCEPERLTSSEWNWLAP